MPDRPRTPSDQVARPRDTATRWVFDKTQAPWAVEASSWGSVALSTDELDRGPGLPERWVAKHYSTRHRREVGLDVISTRVCTFLTLKCNITVRAQHIPTKQNSIADSISRSQWKKFQQLAPDADPKPTQLPSQI